MDTFASASTALRPPTMNIWVSHSNALVTAGLIATMRKIRGCEVRSSPRDHHVHGASTPLNVDVVIADSLALARSFTADAELAESIALTKPQIVLLTATSDELKATDPLPAGVSACLSMDCGQDDLLSTVCGLFGVSRSAYQASPSEQEAVTVRPQAKTQPRGGIAPTALRRVRDHIEEKLGEHLDIDDLAKIAGLSTCHFSRAFKQSVGMPPHRYLNFRRIVAAVGLIESTDRPLSEIAIDVGFSDQSHFTRVFSAQVGESPRRFRHQCR